MLQLLRCSSFNDKRWQISRTTPSFKLQSIRINVFSEDKRLSLLITPCFRLQPCRVNSFKEHKPDKQGKSHLMYENESISKRDNSPRSSGNLWSAEHSSTFIVLRDVKLQMLSGRLTMLLLDKFKYSKAFRCVIDEGISFIAVESRRSTLRLFIWPSTPGKPLNFKHPLRKRVSRELKLQILSGSLTRFSQLDKSKFLRAFKCLIDDGRPFNFEHPLSLRDLRELKLPMFSEKATSFLQSSKSNSSRPFRCLIDNGTSFIDVPLKLNSLSFPIFPLISGKLVSFEQPPQERL